MWRVPGRRAGAIALVAAAGLVSFPSAQAPLPATSGVTSDAQVKPPPPQPPRQPGLPSLPVTRLEDRARAELDGPATLTMAFPRPQPVQDVLRVLVANTPFSIVVDPDVTGTYAGELKDVTMRQALEAVLFPLNLDYEVKDLVIRVFTRRPETRMFDVNFLNVRRSLQRGVRSSVSLQGNPPATELTTAISSDVLEELGRGVQGLLSGRGRMHVDRGAGLVTVTDFADRLDQIGVYLEAVQQRALRQVRIEAHVLDVTIADASRATLDWTAIRSAAGGASTAGLKVQNIAALLDAIARQGAVKTIASPQVLAMNNEPAVMRFGTQEVSFDVPSAPRAEDRRTVVPAATGLFAGLTLTVTAQIGSDGLVQMSVSPTFAEKTGQVRSPGGGQVPVLTITEADTLVRVQEGETVVISGLLQDRTRVTKSTGVASLFGSEKRETVASELVILLTPTVVLPGAPSTAAGGTR